MTRGGEKVPRGSTPPPCHDCPKKSPEAAKGYEMSRRSFWIYELYLKGQATNGAALGALASDPEIQRDLAICHQIVSVVRNHKLGVEIAESIAQIR